MPKKKKKTLTTLKRVRSRKKPVDDPETNPTDDFVSIRTFTVLIFKIGLEQTERH